MAKARVYLYGLRQFALLVPYKSGVIYQQQTAGVCCHQQELEGLVFPLDEYVLDPLREITENAEELTPDQADACDKVFRALNEEVTTDLSIDRARLSEAEEAWLWVLADGLGPFSIEGISMPVRAVLTWENSD